MEYRKPSYIRVHGGLTLKFLAIIIEEVVSYLTNEGIDCD